MGRGFVVVVRYPTVGAVVAMAVGLQVSTAAAEALPPAALELQWSAPAACPGEARVRTRIGEILGNRGEPEPRLTARVQVSGEQGGFRATMTMVRAGVLSERRLHADDCDKLTDAIALVLALMLAPKQPGPSSPPPIGSPPPKPPPREVEPEPSPAGEPAFRGTDGGRSWLARLGSGAIFGPLPAPAVALSAAAGWTNQVVSLEIGGDGWLPTSGRSHLESDLGADFWALGAYAQGCYRLPLVPGLRADGCGGLGGRWMSASGFGMSRPSRTDAAWVEGRGSLALSLALSEQLELRPVGHLLVALSPPPAFAIQSVETIHRPSPLGAGVDLAIEARF